MRLLHTQHGSLGRDLHGSQVRDARESAVLAHAPADPYPCATANRLRLCNCLARRKLRQPSPRVRRLSDATASVAVVGCGCSDRLGCGAFSGISSVAWEGQDTQTSVGTHAGTYVFGSKGSNACPEGSTRIVNWLVCAVAVEDMENKYFNGNESTTSYPAGCIVSYGSRVYFNTASTGAAEANTAPLCIPGAPPRFCAAIVSHPADTLGVLVRYHASNQSWPQGAPSEALKQTLLQSAQSRSDECATCM
jgi:hypothetical protein